MQDVQNIPNPDVNSTEHDDDFSTHSDAGGDFPDTDVEQPNDIPVPPDTERNVPIEEPPESEKPAVDEDTTEPKRIV